MLTVSCIAFWSIHVMLAQRSCPEQREWGDSGEMYYHLLVPLAFGALALAVLAVALGHNSYVAFFGLILSSTSQASNPLEWGYPATYLSGPALSSGWAVANCISAYGGAWPCFPISCASCELFLRFSDYFHTRVTVKR